MLSHPVQTLPLSPGLAYTSSIMLYSTSSSFGFATLRQKFTTCCLSWGRKVDPLASISPPSLVVIACTMCFRVDEAARVLIRSLVFFAVLKYGVAIFKFPWGLTLMSSSGRSNMYCSIPNLLALPSEFKVKKASLNHSVHTCMHPIKHASQIVH